MSSDACSFILFKQGVANLLYLLLRLLSRRIGFCLLMLPLRPDLLCDSQPFERLISSATLGALLLTKWYRRPLRKG